MPNKICWRCVGEDLVSLEIKRQPRRVCSNCGSQRQAILLPDLARRVDAVYQNIVGTGEEGYVERDGGPGFGPIGDYPCDIIAQMLETDDDRIGRDLVSWLADHHRHRGRPGDDGYDFYDETSDHYAILDETDDWFRRSWEGFCDDLKHHRRFFIGTHGQVLDDLLGPLIRGEWPAGGAIRTIGPGTDYRHIYRGRLANDASAQRRIYSQRRRQLGAPTPGIAGAGRMNAAGISVFYGSFDRDTCVAELRTPVSGHAVVGRFEILTPLRVLDLTLLEDGFEPLSYFDDNYSQMMSYQAFMTTFHEAVRRAVLPGQETLDYLPTQVIAEYLWSQDVAPLHGMIFASSLISDSANNVVLFPHAATVEQADDEPERLIASSYVRQAERFGDGELVDPEDEDVERVQFAPVDRANGDAESNRQRPFVDDPWFLALLDDVQPVAAEDAHLRLGNEDVYRIRVDGIRYQTHAIAVRFEGEDEAGPAEHQDAAGTGGEPAC